MCIGNEYIKKYSDDVMKHILVNTLPLITVYPSISNKVKKICEELLNKIAVKSIGSQDTLARVKVRSFLGGLMCYVINTPKDVDKEDYIKSLVDIIEKK